MLFSSEASAEAFRAGAIAGAAGVYAAMSAPPGLWPPGRKAFAWHRRKHRRVFANDESIIIIPSKAW